ncbi:hypothetical protein QUF76_04010 [Desulfobacterales bacterium HSG16]|nr:hypothetical protein [Desulfobacterales bacterium HSG16]
MKNEKIAISMLFKKVGKSYFIPVSQIYSDLLSFFDIRTLLGTRKTDDLCPVAMDAEPPPCIPTSAASECPFGEYA